LRSLGGIVMRTLCGPQIELITVDFDYPRKSVNSALCEFHFLGK